MDDDDELYGDDGFDVTITHEQDGLWATWRQAGIAARGDTRSNALRALADHLDAADAWVAGLRDGS